MEQPVTNINTNIEDSHLAKNKPSSLKKILSLFVLILMVVVISGPIFFILGKQSSSEYQQITNVSQITPIVSPSVSPVQRNNDGQLQKYIGDGFQFSYLPEFGKFNMQSSYFGVLKKPVNENISFGKSEGVSLSVFGPYENIGSKSLESRLKELGLVDFRDGSGMYVSHKVRNVNGQTMVHVMGKYDDKVVSSSEDIYFTVNSNVYSINLRNEITSEYYSDWFEKSILSIILDKINPKSEVETESSWKSYESKAFNLALKYPDDFVVIKDEDKKISIGKEKYEYLLITKGVFTDKYTPCSMITPKPDAIIVPPCMRPGDDSLEKVNQILVSGKKANSFYITKGGPDNDFHIIEFPEEKLVFEMYISGGGLDDLFKKILASISFK